MLGLFRFKIVVSFQLFIEQDSYLFYQRLFFIKIGKKCKLDTFRVGNYITKIVFIISLFSVHTRRQIKLVLQGSSCIEVLSTACLHLLKEKTILTLD